MSMFTIDFNLGFIPLNWDGFRWVINQVIQKIVKNIGNRTIVLFSCVIQEITNLFCGSKYYLFRFYIIFHICNVMHYLLSNPPIILYIAMQCNATMERLGYIINKTSLTSWELCNRETIAPEYPPAFKLLRGLPLGGNLWPV
jgi:hypothetical protein